MKSSMAIVIPIRTAQPQSRKLDLALALAMLSKSVKAHERARRAKLALLARSAFRLLEGYPGTRPLGA